MANALIWTSFLSVCDLVPAVTDFNQEVHSTVLKQSSNSQMWDIDLFFLLLLLLGICTVWKWAILVNPTCMMWMGQCCHCCPLLNGENIQEQDKYQERTTMKA
jgi:hypothetical protein